MVKLGMFDLWKLGMVKKVFMSLFELLFLWLRSTFAPATDTPLGFEFEPCGGCAAVVCSQLAFLNLNFYNMADFSNNYKLYQTDKNVLFFLKSEGYNAVKYLVERRRGDGDYAALHFYDQNGKDLELCSAHNMKTLKKNYKSLKFVIPNWNNEQIGCFDYEKLYL
jgi:hypothetical protein